MRELLSQRAAPLVGALALTGIGIRVYNAFAYPISWGYDSRFNWQYIYRVTRLWELPDPELGWSTGDPPFFYYVSGLLVRGLELVTGPLHPNHPSGRILVRLSVAAAGLAVVGLAVALARRADPERPRRALLAGGLLLFLPAHVYMSAMVNKEMLATLLVSLALFALARPEPVRAGPGRALSIGLAAGLAVLTKLTGALATAAALATYALEGWRRAVPAAAARGAALLLAVAALTGGWYYARNLAFYGYLQPHALPAHERMFSMPPGERSLADYLYVPLATWTDPQALNPDLLRSVWGTTYATTWFDGHRFFLPAESDAVTRLGTVTLLLALLPTAAWGLGAAAGLRRCLRGAVSPDAPLLAFTALALAGFAWFTWQNPWFAVVKGTSLLSLSLPFAFYASDALERWTRARPALWVPLAALALASVLCSTFDLAFEKLEISGLPWNAESQP